MLPGRSSVVEEMGLENVVAAVEKSVVCRKHYCNRKDLAIEAHRCCSDHP